ncbi:aldehyde dehydrogenase family protein, partial [Arsukibacterium sp.]|uniref:aldehyde dehydrogenase family protein n=1 Tax=Arsukibacterium sp. TaxID=1977258 RepID=UPI00299EF64B
MTQQVKHFIDGEFVTSNSDKLIPVTNPATQEVIAQVPCATKEEMTRAVESAKAAFLTWKEVPVSERARLMMRFAHLLKEHQADIADI